MQRNIGVVQFAWEVTDQFVLLSLEGVSPIQWQRELCDSIGVALHLWFLFQPFKTALIGVPEFNTYSFNAFSGFHQFVLLEDGRVVNVLAENIS